MKNVRKSSMISLFAGLALFGMMMFGLACGGPAEVCPGGNCDQTCSGSCSRTCTGGGCNQVCPSGASCSFTCAKGGCKQKCSSGATSCQFTCAGGKCEQDCGLTGVCTCAPGNCS